MNKPEPTDPMVDAINVLRARDVPEGAKARVFSSLQRSAVVSPSWWSRLPRPKLVVGVGLLCGGGALASYELAERSAAPPKGAPSSSSDEAKGIATQLGSGVGQRAAPPSEEPPESEALGGAEEVSPELATSAPRKMPKIADASLRAKPSVSATEEAAPKVQLDRELAEQVQAYKTALSTKDVAARVAKLRAFKVRYPLSPLLHEVDLNLVIALGRAQSPEQQRAAARQFLREHPQSARAAEMQALAEGEAQ